MTRHAVLGLGALLVALAVAPYLGTISHAFVHDDHMVVEDNPVVLGNRFSDVLVAAYHAGSSAPTRLYRPLTTASLVLNHAVGGLDPRGYHAANVVLHALVSLAVFGLGLVLGVGVWGAWTGAALFAVHPVHVEGVAYVSGRADVLSGLLFLTALAAYVHGRTTGRGAVFVPVAGVAFFLALAAKESALPFPAVALAWEALPGRRCEPAARRLRTRAALGVAAALVVPLVAYVVLRQRALGTLLPPGAVTFVENPVVGQGLVVRWATCVAVFGRAILLFLYPWRQSPDYSFAEIEPVTSPLDPLFLAGSLALGLVVYGLVSHGRRRPRAAFLVLFTLLSYVIVSNAFVLIGTIFAERLLYLPSAGLCLLAGLLLAAWRKRSGRIGAVAVTALLVAVALARTAAWSAVWRDNFTLFSAAARTAPRSVKVLGNVGAGLALRGRVEEARAAFEKALAIDPSSLPNRFNLAKVLFAQGELERAEKEIRTVLEADPKDGHAWAQLGLLLQRREDLPGAEAAFRQALAVDPKVQDARLGLAWIEVERNDLDGAERDLLAAVEEDPRSVTGLHGLGVVELRRGSFERALSWLERAARVSSPDAPLLTNVARAYEGMGQTDRAIAIYRRALEVDPHDAGAAEGLTRLTGEKAPARPTPGA